MLTNLKKCYERDGFVSPVRILNPEETLSHRLALENAEAEIGPLHYKFKVHTILSSPYELSLHPLMLDMVEALLGPNILLYNVSYIIKEPHTPAHVSWHQDLTYWGLSSDKQVSVWLALSPAIEASGCMRMVPGSHKKGRQDHIGTDDKTNVLLKGQQVPNVNESESQLCELQPGEASFHHGWTLHSSMPNQSDVRRIGLNFQYFNTETYQTLHDSDTALLVRGVDEYNHFRKDIFARKDLDPLALERRKLLEKTIHDVYALATEQKPEELVPELV